MKIYKILSTLLCYPEPELVAAVPELRAALAQYPLFIAPLWPILDDLECSDLIDLQEKYVQTFDRSPAHSLCSKNTAATALICARTSCLIMCRCFWSFCPRWMRP